MIPERITAAFAVFWGVKMGIKFKVTIPPVRNHGISDLPPDYYFSEVI